MLAMPLFAGVTASFLISNGQGFQVYISMTSFFFLMKMKEAAVHVLEITLITF